MNEKHPFKIYTTQDLQNSSLIVGWHEDVGELGARVVDYLNEKLGSKECGEIEPVDFFPLGGVSIEDNVANFPESRFYCCQEKNLVIFKSSSPRYEWYRFLSSVLDAAEHHFGVKEVYAIGGMVSLSAHTSPRQLVAVSNMPKMKNILSHYGLARDIDYETPPGQRPTLNTFLLWSAKNRNIPAAALWVPIPFYLLPVEDPKACRTTIEFFDKRFSLGIDFTDIDEAMGEQNEKLARIRSSFSEIDRYIRNLESNLTLSQEENEKLAKEMAEFLKRID